MQSTGTTPLALRAGHFTASAGIRNDSPGVADARAADYLPGREVSLALLLEPERDNPWELDAVLATADAPDDPEGMAAGTRTLAALLECLRQEPSPEEDFTSRLPGLLTAVRERAREAAPDVDEAPLHTPLTVILVKSRRYYLVQEVGDTPAYLLRNGELRPLAPRRLPPRLIPPSGIPPRPGRTLAPAAEPAVEPGIATGHLEDGDALLVGTSGLHRALTDRDLHHALMQAHTPAAAAAGLVREAWGRTELGASVGVLFIGMGPALAARLRPGWHASTHDVGLRAPPAAPNGEPVALTPAQGRAARPFGPLVAVIGVVGIALGLGLGVALGGALARPTAQETATPLQMAANLEPPRGELQPEPSTPLQAPITGPAAPTWLPSSNRARGAARPSVGDPTPPSAALPPAAPAASPVPRPASYDGPPVHTLAQGMSTAIQLSLVMDLQRGALSVAVNQGALYAGDTAQAFPAGTSLITPLAPQLLERLRTGGAELRLLASDDQLSGVVGGEELQRLGRGELVRLPGVQPGSYRLVWGYPGADFPPQPFLTLRLQGL